MLKSLVFMCILATQLSAYFQEEKLKDFETHPLDLIAKFIRKNPTILEAGGHYGHDTQQFVIKWPDCTVHSFEPNPHAFELLTENTKDLKNVHRYPFALANFNGKCPFYVCWGTYNDNPIFEGASSLLPANDYMAIHYQGPVIEVECVRLSDWVKENNIGKIDFMWLDMEGYELQVLSAAPEVLAKTRVIFVETNFQEFRIGMTQYNSLKNYLEEQGFDLLVHWYTVGLQGNAIFLKSKHKKDYVIEDNSF